MSWRGKKVRVLVTGGAGFIGSHVIDRLLDDGHEVTTLDNFSTGRPENLEHVASNISLIRCDIAEIGDWISAFEGVDWVIHLAALADIVPSIQQPLAYYQSNVTGTFNVLEAARHHGVSRFVYSASSSCYGIPTKYPTSESAKIDPQYPYAVTKWLGEELVLNWQKIYNLPAVSLRFFNVYGPRSRTSGTYGAVFGVFLAQKLAKKPLTIVGDGNQTRDFTYVTDVADAVLAAVNSDISGEIMNVGSGRTVSVNTLASLIGGNTVHIPKRPGEPDCTFADIEKIRSVIGWQPKINIETGVANVLEEIEYWRNAPVWTVESIAKATEDWFRILGDSNEKV